MIKTFLAFVLLVTGALFAPLAAQSPGPPELSGTWKLNRDKSDLQDDYRYAVSRDEQSLIIDQREPEVRIMRRYASGDANSIIYTDGRSAKNRDTNGDTVASNTKWEGKNLVSRYAIHRSFKDSPETVDVIDEWTVSSDGKTLTLKTTMRYLQRGTDAAHREPFRGNVPRLWLKRIYDRT
jgi:hypothetical protein